MTRGTVLEREGGTYRVLTAGGEVRAALRGRVKHGAPKVVVGDRVTLEAGGAGLWAIAAVDDRAARVWLLMANRRRDDAPALHEAVAGLGFALEERWTTDGAAELSLYRRR